jgi:hypothetical protein
MPGPGRNKASVYSSRYLADRSYLYYQYPQAGGDPPIEFFLPMLENIEISESQRSNLATIDLIGRAGNLYSYMGAKSREFQLRFYMTLPNIAEYSLRVGLPTGVNQFKIYREFISSNFTSIFKRGQVYKSNKDLGNRIDYQKTAIDEFRTARDSYGKNSPVFTNVNVDGPRRNSFIEFFKGTEGKPSWLFDNDEITWFEKLLGITKKTELTSDAVNYMMIWLNVVRTSTLNSGSNTSLGPPTIYINHGTMYNNIPCVCNSYSVSIEESAGYDLVTLTPRRIQVTLNLSENRTGNFGSFVPFKYVEGENAAGWEAVIDRGTTDPYTSNYYINPN